MIQSIRGFRDILPGETELWQYIEKEAISVFSDFGFKEIRIPVMEKTELFARSIGEDTDIVEKEMYTFPDRKGDLLTLRPEATASVVRSYIQQKIYAADPAQKFYTIGPMFRRERPQKGRYRQFYQINAEIFGVAEANADALLIFMLMTLLKRLQVTDIEAHVNSLGCPECRPTFRNALIAFLSDRAEALCADCTRRMDKNPLRVLDCKVPGCREAATGAPAITDHLCTECADHFETLKASLEGLDVPFVVDKRLVRGLDYYTRSTFEILTGALGAQNAVAGGGRYDGLIKLLGGPDLPATGFAIGLDRLAELVPTKAESLVRHPDIYIAALGEKSLGLAFQWICTLALSSIRAETDYSGRSLKSQMKRADRLDAAYTLIVGEQEIENGAAVLRNMKTSDQQEISLENLPKTLADIIGA